MEDAKTMDTQAPLEAPAPAALNAKTHKGYQLLPGNAWNPLEQWPRNEACWCGSGKKAKKCCLLKAYPVIKAELAQNIRKLMGKGIMGRAAVRMAFVDGTKMAELERDAAAQAEAEAKLKQDQGGN